LYLSTLFFFLVLFFLLLPPPPRSTLFPYTTLFRSGCAERPVAAAAELLLEKIAEKDGFGAAEQIRNYELTGGRQKNERSRGKDRSEEHTSELQSQSNLVCRLLLEKKKKKKTKNEKK